MRRINQTAIEMILGIIFSTLILQIISLLVVSDKAAVALGLWIGAATASCMVLHMNYSIDKALDMGQDAARKSVISGFSIRIVTLVGILLIVALTKKADFLACLIGILTLKVAVYLQPITHRMIRRVRQ